MKTTTTFQQEMEDNLQSELGITISNVLSLANSKQKILWKRVFNIYSGEDLTIDEKEDDNLETTPKLADQQQRRAEMGPEKTSTPEAKEEQQDKEPARNILAIMKTVDLTSDSESDDQMTNHIINDTTQIKTEIYNKSIEKIE